MRTFNLFLAMATLLLAAAPLSAQSVNLAGLSAPVTVYEDADGIPTISAATEADAYQVMGYLHARDRFFQMDFNRRAASGRLAELVGQGALSSDIELRTLGLRRAALATYQALDNEVVAALQSYANGVNAWLAEGNLPPEYTVLELSSAEPWTPVDTLVIGKVLAFQLSFDLDIDATIKLGTYQAVGNAVGFDGTALFFEDTHRIQPPDDRVTVPNFLSSIGGIGADSDSEKINDEPASRAASGATVLNPQVDATTLEMAHRIRDRYTGTPLLEAAMKPAERQAGSNWWVIAGDRTESGAPMLLNDPHLSLNQPAIFYEAQLVVAGEYAVNGVSFPGIPGIVQGCTEQFCWGSTVHPMDVTDVYSEQFQVNAFGLPTHTIYQGNAEPLQLLVQSYRVNQVGDGEADNLMRAPVGYDAGAITFIVPRRNNGPVLDVDGSSGISVQYTGWGPTFELEAFRQINRAGNLDEFEAALQKFDIGSQNFSYADRDGNIAYFATAENPIRADLQAGNVDGGIPPFIIRDGTGTLNHEWLPVMNPQPDQALPFEIMPFSEMPQVMNPDAGYIANANNDPIGVTLDNNALNQVRPGGGLYYLNPGYAAYRMGRIDRVIQFRLDNQESISVDDMTALQADDRLLDAELMMDLINNALLATSWQPVFDLQNQANIQEALSLLRNWNFQTPTGIAEGYDAGDDPMALMQPDQAEIENSAAATIFAMFRSQLVRNIVDATLQRAGVSELPGSRAAYNATKWRLLNFQNDRGIGASGLDFFQVDGAPSRDAARDFVILTSLDQALDRLASDEFAPAFGNSTDLTDYRWGLLHRITFDHPLNADPFNIPNGGGFMDVAPDLPGVARQGGYEAVDASSHSARANSLNGFRFGSGPARRFYGLMGADGISGGEIIPGSNPGNAFDPRYGNQLGRWLTNQYHDFQVGESAAATSAVRTLQFQP